LSIEVDVRDDVSIEEIARSLAEIANVSPLLEQLGIEPAEELVWDWTFA
jgi:hypothetical protein